MYQDRCVVILAEQKACSAQLILMYLFKTTQLIKQGLLKAAYFTLESRTVKVKRKSLPDLAAYTAPFGFVSVLPEAWNIIPPMLSFSGFAHDQ